jgi:hypothetical protein
MADPLIHPQTAWVGGEAVNRIAINESAVAATILFTALSCSGRGPVVYYMRTAGGR